MMQYNDRVILARWIRFFDFSRVLVLNTWSTHRIVSVNWFPLLVLSNGPIAAILSFGFVLVCRELLVLLFFWFLLKLCWFQTFRIVLFFLLFFSLDPELGIFLWFFHTSFGCLGVQHCHDFLSLNSCIRIWFLALGRWSQQHHLFYSCFLDIRKILISND